MPVLYGTYSFRPGPQVTITTERQTLEDGRLVGMIVRATLHGKIVVENPAGVHISVPIDSRLSKIIAKQKEIREALAVDGKMFEVQGWDGSAPVKFPARVRSIEFGEGTWVDLADYTIELEGDEIAGEVVENFFIEQASESWSFEEADNPRTTRVTHNLSAKGKAVYDATGLITKPAWQYAKDFVDTKIGLGYTTSIPVWSPKSGQSFANDSVAKPRSIIEWNRTVQETIDELEGSYSVVETWILSKDPFVEEYNVTVRRVDEPNITTTASINGTIRGLFKNQGDHDRKYEEAKLRWDVVRELLYARCQDRVASIKGETLNVHPINASVDHNVTEGTITYNYEFDDKVLEGDAIDVWTVTKRTGIDDYKVSVTVDGTVTGVVYFDDDANKEIKFQRAKDRWEVISLLVLARAKIGSGVDSLRPFPIQAQVVASAEQGTITYNYEFDNRATEDFRHEFTVTKRTSRQDGIETVTIEGTITAMRKQDPDNPFGTGEENERFETAVSTFNAIEPNLIGVMGSMVDMRKINPKAVNTSVAYNYLQGTVTYSKEYNSIAAPCYPNALSESVTITDDDSTKVIAIIPVLGRKKGPIIQDIGTIKEKRRSVTVEVILEAPAYPCASVIPPKYDLTPYAPIGGVVYKEADQTTWTPQTGRLTRSVSWVYTN